MCLGAGKNSKQGFAAILKAGLRCEKPIPTSLAHRNLGSRSTSRIRTVPTPTGLGLDKATRFGRNTVTGQDETSAAANSLKLSQETFKVFFQLVGTCTCHVQDRVAFPCASGYSCVSFRVRREERRNGFDTIVGIAVLMSRGFGIRGNQ